MDNLTFTILIGVATSLVASILFHFSMPLFKSLGEKITLFLIKSNKAFANYLTRVMANKVLKTYDTYYIYYVIVIILGVSSYFFTLKFIERTKVKNEVISYLKENKLQINGANYLNVLNDKQRQLQINEAEETIKNIPSLNFVYVICGVLFLLVFILTIRIAVLLTVKNYVIKFNKRLEIVRPKIGEIEYIKIKSAWLQMENFSDYTSIMRKLSMVINENSNP